MAGLPSAVPLKYHLTQNRFCEKVVPVNIFASKLGRRGRGKKKTMTARARAARALNLVSARSKRWPNHPQKAASLKK